MSIRSFLLIIGFSIAGFFCGAKWQQAQMRPQIAWAVRSATEQSDIAKQWEAQYRGVYPLVNQWRAGYEDLAKRCGASR